LHDGTQRQAVAGGDQVDGRPHQRGANRLPPGDQVGQLVVTEALQPRPQADVWIRGHLGLHADQSLDRRGRRQLPAAKQHLPLEQRAVERAPTQHRPRGAHVAHRAG